MIQDLIAITKSTRVVIDVDRDDSTFKRASIVDELVAEFWVPEGAEADLPPWIQYGIETTGWKMTRHAGQHVVPEVDGAVGGPNWRAIATQMAESLSQGNIQEARDMHEIASLQQAMVDEPAAHVHEFDSENATEPTPDAVCTFEGCRLRYEDRP